MNKDFGYVDGFLSSADRIVAVLSSAKLEAQNVHHGFIGYWKNGVWDYWDEDFDVIKAVQFDGAKGRVIIGMGMFGEITVADAAGFHSETIDSTDNSPSRVRPLNDLRCIGAHVYVAGMRRQVYRRPLRMEKWERCDAGVLVSADEFEIAGFTSIDGFSDDEVYAVGYGGQIWQFDGHKWERISSPTNVRLEAIRCLPSGVAVAVGAMGIIVKGRKDRWEVVQQDLSGETFTDVDGLQDIIFIATDVGMLFRLDGSNLTRVKIPVRRKITTNLLDSDGRALLSVGERDLLLFDGQNWNKLPDPDLPRV